MALPSTTVNWTQVNSFTERAFIPTVQDQIFRSNALFSSVPKQTLDGGLYISQPLMYGEGPGGPYSGVDPLDISEAEQFTVANFAWKFYYAAITYRQQDKLMNSGKHALANLIKNRVDVGRMTMENQLGTGLHSDGSTTPKHITGLRAGVTGTGTTYGQISKTTNAWWRSPLDTTTTVLSLSAMRTRRGSATENRIKPNLGLTTRAIYNLYWNLLQPQERYVNTNVARAGFTTLGFEDMSIVEDSHCPDSYLYMLNTNYMKLYSHSAENMRFRPFMEPVDRPQLRTAFLLWAGNLAISNCRFQTVMTAITS